MAHAHLLPIKTAAALFPLLAMALLLPTAVVLYRRHGVMSPGRTLSLYGFLYYGLTAFCMTVVPLPKRTPDMCERYAVLARPQWVPGNTFGDIWKEAHHKVNLNALVLQNPAVAGTLFNLLLLLPLGVFLRYHFRRGLRATAGIGLAVSLFFELTQWTGIWGIYDCPYRLFDVDDLLVNTAGTVTGWLAAGPVARVLPALETLDGRALAARPVPFGRRLVALVVDLAGYAVTSALATGFLTHTGFWRYAPRAPLGVLVAWFVLLPMATGATPGKRLLLLRLETLDGGPLAPWRLAVRALVLAVAALPLWAGLFLAMAVVAYDPSLPGLIAKARWADGREAATLAFLHPGQVLMALTALAAVAAYALRTLRHPQGLAPHERLSGVRNAALPHSRAVRPPERPAAMGAGPVVTVVPSPPPSPSLPSLPLPPPSPSPLPSPPPSPPSPSERCGAGVRAEGEGAAQAWIEASSTTVTSGGAPTRTGGPQAPAPRVT